LLGPGLGLARARSAQALQGGPGNALATRAVLRALAERPGGQAGGRSLARQHVQTISGRYVGDIPGSEANVREDVIGVLDRLLHLWSITIPAYEVERLAVFMKPQGERLGVADIPSTIGGLKRNEEQSLAAPVIQTQLGLTVGGPLGAGQRNAKADVIALQNALHANWNLNDADFASEKAAVEAGPDPVDNGRIPGTLRGIAAFKRAYVDGTSRKGGVLAGTGPPPPQAVADRDAALITPGTATTTTVVGGVKTVTAAAFKDKVKIGGKDLTYRDDLWQAMDAVKGWMLTNANAMFKRPKVAMSAFEAIGDTAKGQVDALWGTYGAFGPPFHTGVNLQDASLRTGDATDMITYLVDNQAELGVVRARHNAQHLPGNPETVIAANFKRDYLAHGSNTADLKKVDEAWPALNSGGNVSIQPFEGATKVGTRRMRWEALQTMIHEYFHSLNHPNYYRVARTLGHDQESVLVEGGASLMTDETWHKIYPGVIQASDSLRAAVEGEPAPFTPGVIPPISRAHYHPQFEQCKDIQKSFGPANFTAAFLTGRMELIGYPTANPPGPATATASQRFTVPPTGVSSLADVAYMTRSTTEELAGLNSLPQNAPLKPGQVLLVPGRP
jgi:hypothetical protein